MKIQLLSILIFIVCVYANLEAQTLILCDKEDGVRYLQIDEMDGYYDKVNSLEIAIQLKDTQLHIANRKEAVQVYRASYENEVLEMNEEEQTKLQTMFDDMLEECRSLNPHVLPDSIRLIMVKGDHYGPSTFFTRGHSIVFSKSSLKNMDDKNFRHVMHHELFHIISRYHPSLRESLYNLVGFEYIEGPIWLDKKMHNKLLYNPDGVSMDYGIRLMMKDSTKVLFVPVISASSDQYLESKPAFFNYLHFQLMPLDETEHGYFMRSMEKTKDLDYGHIMQQYFGRITMNTQYIIHADEILADNFLYLFRSEEENAQLDLNLQEQIRKTITSYQP